MRRRVGGPATVGDAEERQRKAEQQDTASGTSSGGITRVEVVHVVKAQPGANMTQAQFDKMLEDAGRSGHLSTAFSDALGRAARSAGGR